MVSPHDKDRPAIPGGQPIDDKRLKAVSEAVRAIVNTITYSGIPIGGYVPEEDITKLAIAAIVADDNFAAKAAK